MGTLAAEHRGKVIEEIRLLQTDKSWLVQIKRYSRKRTIQQNAFLHAVPLRILAQETGNDVEDIKDYLLGEAFGWETKEVFGAKKRKPIKAHTSDLNTEEFNWFLEWIESWAARELNITIPKPNEYIPEDDNDDTRD